MRSEVSSSIGVSDMAVVSRPVRITIPGGATLEGDLDLSHNSHGIVIFAHGSGSSRHSPRNKYVAQVLQRSGIATLLMDLLTADEEVIDEQTRHLRFDINLLSERLAGATDWLVKDAGIQKLDIGYFGASTGAAAALVASALRPDAIKAVVSRAGRPDLAGESLENVMAPTLLIVGGYDYQVIEMNQEALDKLQKIKDDEKRLVIVPRATHLFEEPGKLEQVAKLAAEWFSQHLGSHQGSEEEEGIRG